jgi:hypothetical protein
VVLFYIALVSGGDVSELVPVHEVVRLLQ